jgi:rubrerythrin
MPQKKEESLKILRMAIQAEIEGYEFYMVAAEKTQDSLAKEMFQSLAQDEVMHRQVLEERYKHLIEKGRWQPHQKLAGRPAKGPHSPIFKALAKAAKGPHFEMSALSVGALLEQKAMEFYRNSAREAPDPEAKALFEELAAWEEEHYQLLDREYNQLREEYWAQAHYWPM